MILYDTVILGAGPAGLTAAIYTSRAMISTLVLEKLGSGGQLAITDNIENFPGFPDGINGFVLSRKIEEQAKKFGAHFENAEIKRIDKDKTSNTFQIEADGASFQSKSIIIATGAKPRRLGIKGEDTFIGRGVSFCATCDGAFYRNKVVAVVGGGDSAMDEGLFLTKFAEKVYIIHRRDALRAEKILQKRAFDNPKIEFIWDSIVEEVVGEDKIKQLKIKNVKDNHISLLDVDGMFLYIGLLPNTDIFEGVQKDEQGYIITDEFMKTNVAGIFAAGDCRRPVFRQVATAIGDGAVAAQSVRKYLEEMK